MNEIFIRLFSIASIFRWRFERNKEYPALAEFLGLKPAKHIAFLTTS